MRGAGLANGQAHHAFYTPPFRRRYYRSGAQLWRDLRQLAVLRAQPHAVVPSALRERLMLWSQPSTSAAAAPRSTPAPRR